MVVALGADQARAKTDHFGDKINCNFKKSVMIEPWVLNLPWNFITKISKKHRVDCRLIGAIVSVESNGDHMATRFEPHYRWLVMPEKYAKLNSITLETEKTLQMSSLGLMQIMGANARALGHQGQLAKLFDPKTNLHYGIAFFNNLLKKYQSEKDAVSAYNQGSPRKNHKGEYSNQHYVDKIFEKYEYLKR